MTAAVFLVACTKAKRPAPCPARDLYTASDWFRRARAFVELQGDPWFVLSAEHGLVPPDQLVAPYEASLARMPAAKRRAWSLQVLGDLARRDLVGRRFVILAGRLYRDPLIPALTFNGEAQDLVEVPLRGLGFGQQKARLAELVAL